MICENLLAERKLPEICVDGIDDWKSLKKKLAESLQKEIYGFRPKEPEEIMFTLLEKDEKFCAGKASLNKFEIKCIMDGKTFTFPVYSVIPDDGKKHPFFIHINFRDDVPDKFMPSEEIIDNGFAVLSFCYQDITSDDNDFTNGLAGVIYNGKKRTGSDCGKIAMWSWAASRVMDFAQMLDCLDLDNAAVCGHSRLGKTALLTGMLDERFKFVFSNDSGCSGAALSRGKKGETVGKICNSFPYWFCPDYSQYSNKEEEMPFDQHFLLAASAPRYVYVASAEEDAWADPDSEYLSCCAASEVYEYLGVKGFVHPDRLPIPGDVLHGGNIGYHMRRGRHYFSREDWHNYFNFIKLKSQK